MQPMNWKGCAVALGALIVAPIAVSVVSTATADPALAQPWRWPAARGDWSGPGEPHPDDPWTSAAGARTRVHATYASKSGANVEVLAIEFAPSEGKELVSESNALLGPSSAPVLVVGDKTQSYDEAVVTNPSGHRAVIWSVYNVDGRVISRPRMSQLWFGVRSLVTRPHSVLFVLRATCDVSSCADARELLTNFVRIMGSELTNSTFARSETL